MDNRETLTPSSGDAILKRHLFSEVARNWIKGRGHIGRAYFVRRPSRQSFGFRVAASSGPIPKAPGSAGGYLIADLSFGIPRSDENTPTGGCTKSGEASLPTASPQDSFSAAAGAEQPPESKNAPAAILESRRGNKSIAGAVFIESADI